MTPSVDQLSLPESLSIADPEIAAAIDAESLRQHSTLEMIASENFVSDAIREAVGSVFTNKYAEGYPGKRYYGGCVNADVVETLAIERAKQLFGADHVNVQPHSGAQANMAVFFATLKPGDTILGMDLAHGGHLTHGSKVNFSGTFYNVVHYGVRREDELLDYDDLESKAREHRPKMIIAGASAYPRQIDFERISAVAKEIGAVFLCDVAHYSGLIAAGLYGSPVPHADFVTTTTHKTLRGPRSGIAMCRSEFAKALDKWVFPGSQGGPLVHVIAGKAVCFGEALRPSFRDYAAQVIANAKTLGKTLTARGLRLVSGGTDCHFVLVDLSSLPISGKQAEHLLEEAGVTCNKNMIPYDSRKPMESSGIRLGTAALTTRGFGTEEITQVGTWIADVLIGSENEDLRRQTRAAIQDLTSQYPLHKSL
jgi:glycine hydroxymethyltransferase